MNLNDVNLEPIVAKAIMETITPEARETLLVKAIQDYLTKSTPGHDRFSQRPSPLQEAFNSAVRIQAEKMAREMMNDDEDMKKRLKELLEEVTNRVFTGDAREKLVESMASSLGRAISGDRY